MELEIYGVSAVILIMALVQVAKMMGFNKKKAGLLSLALGVAISIGYTFYQEAEIFRAIVIGLALGASATGLYSAAKNATER